MKYRPHNYQEHATRYAETHTEAALFLQMGLGKTIITLTAINNLLFDTFQHHQALVIAPLRVAQHTWPTELQKWDHLKNLTHQTLTGTRTQREKALNTPADIHIINRENLPWLTQTLGKNWPYDLVIIDELSSFKNHRAKRFKALRQARPHIQRIIGLTGTPTPNGLLDLWAQYRLLDNGKRLGPYITHYRDRFFTPDQRNQHQIFTYKPKPGAEKDIYHLISDITLSMKTTDHLNLPDVTYTTTPINLTPRERGHYEKLQKDLVIELDGKPVDAANAAALSGKLLQLSSGAIYTDTTDTTDTTATTGTGTGTGTGTVGKPFAVVHDRKLDALEDLIEAANANPVLIAYWFKHDLERIQARLPQAKELKTSTDLEAWNARETPVALIHPASAGHGLNLQAGGNILIWFTPTWSLELYQQTNARLHRQGQTQPVTIHHLITENTLDEQVLTALETKNVSQSALIDAVKAALENT